MATLEQHALMVNGFYDVLSYNHFAWYVGAGIGLNAYESRVSYPGKDIVENGCSAIFGAYTGLSLNFEHVGIDLGVDYFYTYKPNINSLVPKIGLRVIF